MTYKQNDKTERIAKFGAILKGTAIWYILS